ncbi:MAG: hypothetical protein JSR76_06465 [Verrucomicrobia bacterium]|nr:hypothetical protein [Verrucomicrobiota bacterium]
MKKILLLCALQTLSFSPFLFSDTQEPPPFTKIADDEIEFDDDDEDFSDLREDHIRVPLSIFAAETSQTIDISYEELEAIGAKLNANYYQTFFDALDKEFETISNKETYPSKAVFLQSFIPPTLYNTYLTINQDLHRLVAKRNSGLLELLKKDPFHPLAPHIKDLCERSFILSIEDIEVLWEILVELIYEIFIKDDILDLQGSPSLADFREPEYKIAFLLQTQKKFLNALSPREDVIFKPTFTNEPPSESQKTLLSLIGKDSYQDSYEEEVAFLLMDYEMDLSMSLCNFVETLLD